MRRRHWWVIGAIGAALVLVIALAVTGSLAAPRAGTATPTSGAPATPSATRTTTTPPPSATHAPPSSAPATTPPGTSQAPPDAAHRTLARMPLEQRVGQLFMVASPVTGADANTLYALERLHIGNVFLKGRSSAGTAGIGGVVADLTAHVDATAGALPFVATDQEGGLVQVMSGPGFSVIPQAIQQGQQDPATLQAEATAWGQQLATAGVNVNLAPVLDTVPGPAFAPSNAPIGLYGREYGFTPTDVSVHGLAFARGMLAAGVQPTAKHFPGLGRVTANTDTAAGVTDDITTRTDPYLQPFRDAVDAGVNWLMISNAYYPRIDAQRIAPFSPVVITGMVRGDLGFGGVVVSDDICDAVQVSPVPVAQRAVQFIGAGGTMALCTDELLVAAMYQGALAAARADPAFAAKVDAAAVVVLEQKAAGGLLREQK
ncbi:glycoside hydrolase family 3 N-terminal domain-containing protein [Specibacter cremeus]|uniref:glycoside hydrolase family 3 N-terminal domain-containing protein n=1 Tax=Specibacter cremeus TaxID=1629051 RepID=UPI000F7AAB96|nr:glycoside hydrolase family 3 N-terminal domain-containing protein [Specibacter cremeus]